MFYIKTQSESLLSMSVITQQNFLYPYYVLKEISPRVFQNAEGVSIDLSLYFIRSKEIAAAIGNNLFNIS